MDVKTNGKASKSTATVATTATAAAAAAPASASASVAGGGGGDDTIHVARYARFSTLKITAPAPHVVQIELNRPKQRNTMNRAFWTEIREAMEQVGADRAVRAVVLTAAGPVFTAGLDLSDHGDTFFGASSSSDAAGANDSARRALALRQTVLTYQNAFNAFERIPQPIVAAVHGPCVGGGVDMVSAADIRVCSADAWFSIKEVDIAMTADVGTFPRLSRVTGNDSLLRELALTGRQLSAKEALQFGLVSAVCGDRAATVAHALALAGSIAAKSPLAVCGIKHVLNYARDHTTADTLQYLATWNMSQLQTPDVMEAASAFVAKRQPIFSKL